MGKFSVLKMSGRLSKAIALLAAAALVLGLMPALGLATAQKAYAGDMQPATLHAMDETYTLSVVVNENDEYTLYNNATVTLESSGTTYEASQDSPVFNQGATDTYTWKFTVPAGTYTATIARSGLATITDTITVTDADVTTGAYTMTEATYGITANASTNGTYTVTKGGSAVDEAAYDSNIVITPSPDEGYELDTITVTKTDDSQTTVAVQDYGGTKYFSMPAYPVTISVTFKAATTTPTYSIAAPGLNSPSVGDTLSKSTGETFTVMPTSVKVSQNDTVLSTETGTVKYEVVTSDNAVLGTANAAWNSIGNNFTVNSGISATAPATAGSYTCKVKATWTIDSTEVATSESGTFTLTVTEAQQATTHTVTFNTDGGTEIAAATVNDGDPVARPATDPTKDGVTFYGWRLSTATDTAANYDFSTAVTDDITLKALYVASTDLSGCYIGANDLYQYADGEDVIGADGIPVKVANAANGKPKKGTTLINGVDYTAKIVDENKNEVTNAKELGGYTITVTGKGMFSGSKSWSFEVSEHTEYFQVYKQVGIGEKALVKTYDENAFKGLQSTSTNPICGIYNTSNVDVAFTYVTLEDLVANVNSAVDDANRVIWEEESVLSYGSGVKVTSLPYETAQNLKYYPDATADPSAEARVQIVKNSQPAPVVFSLTENAGTMGKDGDTAADVVAALTGNQANTPRVVYGVDEQEYLAGEGATLRGMRLWSNTHKITIISDRVDLEDATVTVAGGERAYTGEAFEPDVTVKLADDTEVPSENYTIAYDKNTNAGTATVTVTGKLGAKNSKSATFEIAKANSTIALADQAKNYNGSVQAYDGTVTKTGSTGAVTYKYYSDAACTKEVAAANVKNAGTYYVKATVADDGNYAEATSAAAKLTINKGASTISLAAQSKTYNGKAQAYSGKVTKTGSTGAVTYTYYSDAKCTKSVKAANVKNAGTYYVKATVAADANSAAATSAAAKFTINKKAQPMTLAKTTKTVKFSKVKAAKQTVAINKAKKAQGTVTYSIAKVNNSKKSFSIAKSTGKITVKKGTKKGTYKVTVKATTKGNTNYKGGSKTAVVTIKVK